MKEKIRDASARQVEVMQAAAWRVMDNLGYNDVQESQWRAMQDNPYLMQDYIVRAAQQQGYVSERDIDAFAAKFIQDMERKFGG